MNHEDENANQTSRKIQELKTENATLSAQVAQLNLFIYGDNGYQQKVAEQTSIIEQQAAVIEQMQKTIQITAEQIRKCDYTPARSTLLCVMKDFK